MTNLYSRYYSSCVIYWFYCGVLDKMDNKFLDNFLIQNFLQMNTLNLLLNLTRERHNY